MKKNNFLKKIIATTLLITELGLVFSTNTYAQMAPLPINKIAPGAANPGDTIDIKIGPISPGNLTGVADVALTMDISRSMKLPFGNATCTLGTDCRIDVAKAAFSSAVDTIATRNPVFHRESFATFYGDKTDPVWPTAFETQVHLTNNVANLKNSIVNVNRPPFRVPPPPSVNTGIALGACTSIGGGVQESLDELFVNGRVLPPDYIILATDGLQNFFPSVYDNGILATAIARGVKIFSVGIGIPTTDDLGTPQDDRTAEFTYCKNNPGSGGSFIPSGDPARPTDPTRPTRLYNDLNGNGVLDGEDYLMDIANKTGGTYANTNNASEFNTELNKVLDKIKFPYDFVVSDVINSDVFEPLSGPGAVKLSTNCIDPSPSYYIAPAAGPIVPGSGMPPAFRNYGFTLRTGSVLVGEERCIYLKAKVKTVGVIYGTNFVDSPLGILANCPPNFTPVCWERSIPTVLGVGSLPPVPIGNAQINILNPAPAWLQTTKGDVASRGGFTMTRTGVNNSDYAVFSNDVNTNFNSVKNWLIGSSAPYYSVDLGTFKDFANLKAQFGKFACTTSGHTLPTGDGVFNYTYDPNPLAVTTDVCLSAPGPKGSSSIIFVNGDLSTLQTPIPSGKPRVLIASGNITIDPSVTAINAVLMADEQISAPSGANQLTITGAILGGLLGHINTEPDFERDLGADCAGLCNRNNAGQIINFDPKYYYTLSDYAGFAATSITEERP